MKCIVCDRCRKIIEEPKRCKVVTCSKPLRIDLRNDSGRKCPQPGTDRSLNEPIWEKELCSECAELLDEFMDNTTAVPDPIPDPTPEPEPDPVPDPDPTPDPSEENPKEPDTPSEENEGE